MAAHWEIINKGTAEAPLYLFVNMLGDTLQYNLGSSAIRGKYQPENGKIADDGKFSPEGGTDITWFNSPSTAADANTKRLWTASAIPGKEEGSFVLSLDKHILTGSGSWVASVIRAKTDSVYYKRVVSLEQPAAVLPWTVVNQEDCAGGLILKKSPIYYVPNYSASYGEERGDTLPNTIDRWKTINTNDTSFVDGRVRQDSLTAYLLLHGSYGIKEASRVDNGLMLGSITTEFGAKAAALTAAAANVSDIEFIPLAGSGRNEAIESLKGTANADSIKLDKLYGETYKWFLVKRGSQYLVFDTINPQTDEDHYKVGLTWQTLSTMANATPVRLYQPLVGDKLQGNFIFQFYVPCYTYGTTAAQTYRNIWPTGDGGDIRGKRLFGELSKQSNYIHGVRTLKDATRFTYTYVSPGAPDDCNCPEQFIAPDWMASQKLLSLPLEDQVWLAASTGFGFSTGRGNDATVNNTGITTLKHTYVDSIRPIGSGATLKGRYSYKVGTATTNEDIFKGEVAVPLYYVQNEKGEYLTVSDSTYQYDSRTTASDVTGVNLVWKKDLYPTHATLNKRALQLFAISGAQREPDQNGWYAGCRTYVYLPLASYKVDYSAGKVIKTAIHYNVNLGKAGQLNDCITSAPVNDITTAFRVSQYSPIYDQQKTLIVANASGASLANVVPVELKWKKLKYDEIGCDNYQLVKNYSKTGSKNFYFAAGGDNFDSIPKANSNTILAHWKINHAVDDNQLHTFAFEPVVGYGKNITDENKQLTGNYYFIKIPELTTGDVTTARAFNFANYATYPYTIAEDTLQITCVDHTLPFYNLEPGYELPAQLAILEAPFVDRNLTDVVPGFPHDKVNVNPDAYQVYLNRIGTDINAATYLTAWKTNVRRLGEGKNADETGHDIPYFAFSLNKDGKEYFLNIHKATKATDRDSVYWTYLTDAEQKVIFDDYAGGEPNKGSNRFWNYKFCLPYQVYTERDAPSPERIGELVDPAKYGDTEYQPVYIQTLDTAKNHYPDLVIAGSATRYATARNLYDAILPYANGVNSMNWNIYSVDYSQIDPYYVTSWIFGGKRPADHEWVPLRNSEGVNPYENTNPNANLDADGLLTNFRLQTGGHSFVGESGYDNDKPTEVNYGVLLSKTQLHFEYEGTERIGTYAKRPIYYYRIQIPGQDKKWLTDSYDIGGKYVYTWGPSATVTNKYNLAYFGNKITDNVTGKKYDKKYVQTFGFRYFDSVTGKESSDTIPAKTFVVVSNANFENAQPGAYRYLAEVNGHLVFVEGKDNALLFQFGRDKDGNYTGIEPIGTSGVIGVQGGVRLLNQTGTAAIYTVDGRLIKSVEVTGADQTIVAPRGVVIVKAAGKATKVVVK
jgi:hypothetical protein